MSTYEIWIAFDYYSQELEIVNIYKLKDKLELLLVEKGETTRLQTRSFKLATVTSSSGKFKQRAKKEENHPLWLLKWCYGFSTQF